MRAPDDETFGPVLHGAARAWRMKLDERLRPLGMSQSKWRTLLHLSRAKDKLTQAEIAGLLGIEEPTLVNLLHRLEQAGWVKRETAPHDRRCKTVSLLPCARRVIDKIDATARALRSELMSDIRPTELAICMRVLRQVQAKADSSTTTHIPTRRKSVTRTHGE